MTALRPKPVNPPAPSRALGVAATCIVAAAGSVYIWPWLLQSEEFLVLGGAVLLLLAVNVAISFLGLQYRRSVELDENGVSYMSRGRKKFIAWQEVVSLEPGFPGESQIRIVGLNDSVLVWLRDYGEDPAELLERIKSAAGPREQSASSLRAGRPLFRL